MIVGKNLIIRPLTEVDLPIMFAETANVQERGEFWPICFNNDVKLKEKFAKNGLQEDDDAHHMITDLDGNRLGNIGYFKASTYMEGVEIGGRIFRAENRRKGIITEALKLFTAYVFELKPIERIQICALQGNEGTEQVAVKCGYTREGTLRRGVFHRGKYVDVHVFSMLRRECSPLSDVLASL